MKNGEDSRRKALALAWFFTFCSSASGTGSLASRSSSS